MDTLLDRFGQYQPALGPMASAPSPVFDIGESEGAVQATTEEFTGTSYADVADLSAALETGNTYLIRALVLFTAGGTGGAKFTFTSPAGVHSLRGTLQDWIAPENSVSYLITVEETDVAAALPAGDHAFELNGTITPSENGTLQIRAAQNSANNALSVYTGSYLEVTRIS